jgi:hypothetical protein
MKPQPRASSAKIEEEAAQGNAAARPSSEPARPSTKRVMPGVETVYHVLASVAIIVGGIWALFTYVVQHEGIWNVDLSISSESMPYKDTLRAVVVRVDLQNRGKRAVRAGEGGLELTVVRVPQGLEPYQPVWRTKMIFDDKGQQTVANHIDMLRHYKSHGIYEYELEPAAVYQETEAILAKEGDLLLLEIQFFGPDGDSIRQYKYVTVDGFSKPT